MSAHQILNLGTLVVPITLISSCYPFFRDLICGGQSIGKRTVKIKMINNQGKKPSLLQIFLYDSFVIIWPIEAVFLLIKGMTIGELISKIKFIESM